MKSSKHQRGFLLVVAVILIAAAAIMAAVIVTLTAGSSQAGGLHINSTQALFVAKSGIEHALYGLETDTICSTSSPGATVYSNVWVGTGSYTVTETLYNPTATTLSAAITNSDTTIPLTSSAGYASHGRIQIDTEKIDYSGVSGNNLTGARRAAAGTTAAAHSSGVSVFQNICMIQSVGTVDSSTRTLERSVALPKNTAFLDTGSVNVTTAGTTVGTLNTGLPAGDNLVLARVSLRNTGASGNPQFLAGSLTLTRGATTLSQNQFDIDVGGGATPSNSVFPQETQYLFYKDSNAPANASYSINMTARSNNNAFAEVHMIVINQVTNSSFQDGGTTAIGTASTTMMTHNSTVPAGTNLIFAVAQFNNTSGGTRSINAGNYRLSRGATVLATNQFALNLARQSRVNQGTAMMLVARDVGAPANPSYAVTAQATNNGINGEVKIIVVNGVTSAYIDTGSTAIGTVATTTGTLATTFPAGENIVIASTQYENSAGAQRNILAGNERIVYGGVAQVTSQFDINLCATGTAECNDFDKGLFWRQPTAVQNPTYNVEVLASGAGINGETKIGALHFDYTAVDEVEIFP